MNSFELLKILVDELDAYEKKARDKNALSLEEFLRTLSPEVDLESLKNTMVQRSTIEPELTEGKIELNIERVISQHIVFLNRYVKFYSKMVFADSPIKTVDDFSFLVALIQESALPKTELINRNIFEKSSGIEIINRLVKSGLLVQQQNPNDKRSQLVILTERGRASLFQVFDKMNKLGLIACGDLNNNEKYELAIVLKKLDRFHLRKYNRVNSDDLEDYLPQSAQEKK